MGGRRWKDTMRSGNAHPAVTTPVPPAVWESLYRSDENAVVSQSPTWRDAVFASGRYQDASVLYEFPSGRQVVMPMARRRRQPSQATAVASWPQVWGIGGPITQGGKVSPAEAAVVLGDVARRGTLAAAITLRHDADKAWLSQGRQFHVEEHGCCVVDLAGGFDQVWQHSFRSSTRRAVRKAERSGLEVEVDRSGRLLDVFYDLYQKSLVRWAAAQHEPLWFTRLRMNRVSLHDSPASGPGRQAFRGRLCHLGRMVQRATRRGQHHPAVRRIRQVLAGCHGQGNRRPGTC